MTSEDHVLRRIRAEYLEMPGLGLTDRQARRFLGLDEATCTRVLGRLVDMHFLVRMADGQYVKAAEVSVPVRPRMAKSDTLRAAQRVFR